jgi:hypothetical protein
MRNKRARRSPGLGWLLGTWAAALLVGAGAYIVTNESSPVRPFGPPVVTVTSIHTAIVLPKGQAEVSGTLDAFTADDANGPPLSLPIEIKTGGATIEGAMIDGKPSTIVWDGGRPFELSGSGGIELGPTHVELAVGALFWPIDGLRALAPGEYRVDTPVAVGSGGLARPRDSVSFTATEDTTLETRGGATVLRGPQPLHLEGPGSFTGTGTFTVKTRDGTRQATKLQFGPGAFVVDLQANGAFTAVFNGPLTT